METLSLGRVNVMKDEFRLFNMHDNSYLLKIFYEQDKRFLRIKSSICIIILIYSKYFSTLKVIEVKH